MDKNTLIGLGLIGTLLVTFTILNKPKELDKTINDKNKTEMSSSADSKKETGKSAAAESNNPSESTTEKTVATDSKTAKTGVTTAQKGDLIRLETDKLIYDFSTKGGVLSAVYLKEYQTYYNFAKKKDKIVPMKLFGEDDNVNELSFPLDGKKFTTGNKLFTVVDSSANHIVFELKTSDKQSIQFLYNTFSVSYFRR